MTRDTYGRKYGMPSAYFDHDTQCWRMYQGISLWEEPPSLETLPASGMTRNGKLYPQPPWVHLTVETGSSLWPTPRASLAKCAYWIKRKVYKSNLEEVRPGEEHLIGQPINPLWVEWLMGFPAGHTDSEH